MHGHHDTNIRSSTQAEGIQARAREQMANRHGRSRPRHSMLIGIAVLFAPIIALLWWVFSQ